MEISRVTRQPNDTAGLSSMFWKCFFVPGVTADKVMDFFLHHKRVYEYKRGSIATVLPIYSHFLS